MLVAVKDSPVLQNPKKMEVVGKTGNGIMNGPPNQFP